MTGNSFKAYSLTAGYQNPEAVKEQRETNRLLRLAVDQLKKLKPEPLPAAGF